MCCFCCYIAVNAVLFAVAVLFVENEGSIYIIIYYEWN
jgi:hypothetical protein